MARGILAALEKAGHESVVASDLRLFEPRGDRAAQDALRGKAEAEINRIKADPQANTWRAWVTYHNYYKAPDLIGPVVAAYLKIPYILVEATRAKKRLHGRWSDFAVSAEAATDAARLIFYLTERDAQALRRDAPKGQALIHLRPFLVRDALPPASDLGGPMLSVGMFRPGDKLASYQLIADTLALLPDSPWHLEIAGDGAARREVEEMMAPFGKNVRFLGELDQEGLTRQYERASLLFWPGVNEAFGMTYLEAQAAGVPVVAQDRPGVRDVILPDKHPRPFEGPEALAKRLLHLLLQPETSAEEAADGRARMQRHHLLHAAAKTLAEGLESFA